MPLAVDLYAGLGGWAEGLLAAGWDVIGFDIERHVYGEHRYPGQLVVQDVLTLHGSQFRAADLIVASPPCQFFSYCAMPWTRAKRLAAEVEADVERLEKELALFKACFRLQREASEAAGRHIPLIVENVRGAQRWVGPARWNFGSFYLWGDVPALMPFASGRKSAVHCGPDRWSDRIAATEDEAAVFHLKLPGLRFDGSGRSFQSESVGRKGVPHRTDGHWTNPAEHGTKNGNDWFGAGADCSLQRRQGSKSPARKAASAMIAKIPYPLATHIARVFHPGLR